jgi:hypothetical protein
MNVSVELAASIFRIEEFSVIGYTFPFSTAHCPTVNLEPQGSLGTLVPIYQTTRRHFPEDANFHNAHWCYVRPESV